MKILFFTRSYYPHIGGVEKHIFEISTRLVSLGHEVTIITEEQKSEMTNKYTELSNDSVAIKGITVIRIPISTSEKRKKFQIWKWMWQHRKLIKQSDIIHAHDVFYWYLPFKLLYPRKKVFTTFHGYESYPVKRKAILYRKLFEILSNGNICVGGFMKKWYHANPTTVTYGATNVSKTITKSKNNSAIFIGRLDDQTGIDIYVKAAKLIRQRISDFTLTVYGDGPYRAKLHTSGLILKGFDRTADSDIKNHQFAFISRYLAILEAMAAKRLVFAVYDNPVKEDYLKMTPFKNWIITCSNAEELADKVIINSKNRSEANKKVEKAYEWVKEQSWEYLTNSYLSLWGIK